MDQRMSQLKHFKVLQEYHATLAQHSLQLALHYSLEFARLDCLALHLKQLVVRVLHLQFVFRNHFVCNVIEQRKFLHTVFLSFQCLGFCQLHPSSYPYFDLVSFEEASASKLRVALVSKFDCLSFCLLHFCYNDHFLFFGQFYHRQIMEGYSQFSFHC